MVNYKSSAELFPAKRRLSSKGPVGYKRFRSAAEATRFAIEELPPEQLTGTYLEIGDERFDADAIQRLYESAAYPLKRRAPAEGD